MRITAVSRVLNEDDIIEAFVRHTLAYVDNMLVLDNGSIDRTVEILGALKAEGANLTVLQARSPVFNEQATNSLLYGVARLSFQPDWVCHLDADEFIDARTADLRGGLEGAAPEIEAVKLTLVNYFAQNLDMSEPVIPRRMVHRDATRRPVHKCILRGNLPAGVVVEDGNHGAWVDGRPVAAAMLDTVPLAHFPVRHPVQGVAKSVAGRLKVLAAGGGPGLLAQRADHYTPVLNDLCRDPAVIFANQHRMNNHLPDMPLVHDPIRYAGGELRYTAPSDPVMKALQALASLGEQIATSHGKLLDADPEARARVETGALQPELLFR